MFFVEHKGIALVALVLLACGLFVLLAWPMLAPLIGFAPTPAVMSAQDKESFLNLNQRPLSRPAEDIERQLMTQTPEDTLSVDEKSAILGGAAQ